MQHRNVTGDSFFCWDGDVLIVNILGKPSARQDAIGEPQGNQLRVSVKAKPENGKATDYMVRFWRPSSACGWRISRWSLARKT